MKISDGVEWSIHCCTVLALLPEGTALPAARLAEFHGVLTGIPTYVGTPADLA